MVRNRIECGGFSLQSLFPRIGVWGRLCGMGSRLKGTRRTTVAFDQMPGLRIIVESEAGPPPDHQSVDDRRLTTARAWVRANRLFRETVGDVIFRGPAWEIVLDLYLARLRGVETNVSGAAAACSIPPTTGLRWISALQEAGHVTRSEDPLDGRHAIITLSDETFEAMHHLMDRVFQGPRYRELERLRQQACGDNNGSID